jgi:hypothetical protein
MRAEAAYVHVPEVERRFAGDDPFGHRLADAARPRQTVGAESGSDEEPPYIGLAEAEFVVGRERLGTVDQLGDRHVIHYGDALAGVHRDLLEPWPVLLEQLAVEVGGNRVELVGVQCPRCARPLVATHHEPGTLLTEVHEQIGVAQRW